MRVRCSITVALIGTNDLGGVFAIASEQVGGGNVVRRTVGIEAGSIGVSRSGTASIVVFFGVAREGLGSIIASSHCLEIVVGGFLHR